MATDRTPASKPDSDFSFGMQELRRARAAKDPASLELTQPARGGEARGFDPYNSSGSFDRRKNWERIRKR